MAMVTSQLPRYGVDPQSGTLAWVQGPLVMEIDEYRGNKFGNMYPMVTAEDFVMSSDYTWDTEYGGAGCGFVVRSNGDQEEPNNYMIMSTRLAEGHLFFAVNAQGEMMIVKEWYANGIDPQFDSSNGATNRLTVVGRGTLFQVYSNDTLLGEVDPTRPLPALNLPKPPVRSAYANNVAYQQAVAAYKEQVNKLKAEYEKRRQLWNTLEKDFPAGMVAMGAAADSGRTVCEFNNAWLWLIAK